MLVYKFDDYTLSEDGELTYRNESITLPPKELSLLLLFVSSHGSLLSKDMIIEKIWYGSCVSDESLTRCIYGLRQILGKNKKHIKTFYSRGYKFTPTVTITKKQPKIGYIELQEDIMQKKRLLSQSVNGITYSVTYKKSITHQTGTFGPYNEKSYLINNRK